MCNLLKQEILYLVTSGKNSVLTQNKVYGILSEVGQKETKRGAYENKKKNSRIEQTI